MRQASGKTARPSASLRLNNPVPNADDIIRDVRDEPPSLRFGDCVCGDTISAWFHHEYRHIQNINNSAILSYLIYVQGRGAK